MNKEASRPRNNEDIHNQIRPATYNRPKQEAVETIRPLSSNGIHENHNRSHIGIKHRNIGLTSGDSSEEEKHINQEDKNQGDNNNRLKSEFTVIMDDIPDELINGLEPPNNNQLKNKFTVIIDDIPDEIINGSERPINQIRVNIRASKEQYEHNLNNNIPEEPRDENNEEMISNDILNLFDSDNMFHNNTGPHAREYITDDMFMQRLREIMGAYREGPVNNEEHINIDQLADMNFDADDDLDMSDLSGMINVSDIIADEEERRMEDFFNECVDSKYQRRSHSLEFIFILFVLSYLVLQKYFRFEVMAYILGAFAGAAAVFAAYKLQRDDFKRQIRRWRVIGFLDWIFLLQFCLCTALKIQQKRSFLLTLCTIPGYVGIVLHLTLFRLPVWMRNRLILAKFILWTQLLLISLKLDHYDYLSWKLAFLLVWAVLAVIVFVKVIVIGIFGALFYLFMRGRTIPIPLPIKWQLFSSGTYILTLTIATITLILTVACVELLDGNSQNRDFPIMTALVGANYTVLLGLLTAIFRNRLKELYKKELVVSTNYVPKPRRFASAPFESEDLVGSILYVMISPTFFTTFEKSLLLHEKERLLRLKTYIWNLKGKLLANVFDSTVSKKISIEELKSPIPLTRKEKAKQNEGKKINSVSLQTIEIDGLLPISQREDLSKLKLGLSMDDKDLVEDFKTARQSVYKMDEGDGIEALCFICCVNKPNSVFMRCGHGGICFECAKETWNKKAACMTCRERIKQIVKLVPVKGTNIMKGVSVTKKNYKRSRAQPVDPPNNQ